MSSNLGPTVSGDWLEAHLEDPSVIVLDASWYLAQLQRDPLQEYLAAHVPGALFYDLDAVSDPDSPLPHMLGTPEYFAAAMSELGVGDDHLVVTYDGSGTNLSAARAWWTFKVFGHDPVAVLDGGFVAWRRNGRPVQSGPVQRPPAHFTPRYRPELVRTLDQARDLLATGNAQVVDARSTGRFAGIEPEPRPGLRSGHMPGSLSLPYTELAGPDGLLLDPAALAQRFHAAGVRLDAPVIASCGSGVTACVILLALERLGHEGHAVYDGSWTEWGGRQDTPVDGGGLDWSSRSSQSSQSSNSEEN